MPFLRSDRPEDAVVTARRLHGASGVAEENNVAMLKYFAGPEQPSNGRHYGELKRKCKWPWRCG